ncbi:MAG TPA: pyridoxal-dependent decarboxylase, exosortase A system-associated [Burkholderiales bacterium]|nr:pyridoxal-dependent decarboxylase, exosortase A system-associated [Burkholderiales bacterium]
MNAASPAHAPHSGFAIADDCLLVGGMPVTQLARAVGSTPFYAYDRKLVSARVVELRGQLPSDVHLHYAIKANPMPALVQHLVGLVDGFDVASAAEMRLALDAGMSAQRVSFAGPGKRDAEIAQAIASGVVLNLESEREMERAAALSSERGVRARAAVRVNPDFELRSSGMKMGGGAKPFGVDAECVPALLRRMRALPLEFEGFHVFTGAQNLRADALQEAQQKTLELAMRLSEYAPAPVRTLNIGGGFGIPYFPGERRLDAAAVCANLAALLPEVRARLPHATVVIELGRYLVGEAGVYVCRVVDRKISRGRVFLVTDGGLHHHLAASGNFGQVIRKNYPVAIGNRMTGGERELASVVGPLCTPLDLLAENVELARADVGDLVVIFQSGAYGLTASPTAFLGHPLPAEVLV